MRMHMLMCAMLSPVMNPRLITKLCSRHPVVSVSRCLRLNSTAISEATSNAEQQLRPIRRADLLAPVPQDEGVERLPFYSQYPLDRKVEWRSDDAKLAQLFAQEDATLMYLSKWVC